MKITIFFLILVIFFSCKDDDNQEFIPVTPKTQSVQPINSTGQRIYAWEPPFNLSEDDIPSDVASKLQSAIDFATTNNKQLVIEKGEYVINSQITFSDGADIDFGGAEFIREAGTGTGDIFTMFTNGNYTSGNKNITISNLKINGNRRVNNLDEVNYLHRFSGLKLVKVTDSKLYRITVTQTVNGEIQLPTNTSASGIFFESGCSNINCYELTAYDNSRTGILINASNGIRIFGSLTYNNTGSGISSDVAPRCEYYDVVSYHNGYEKGHVWGNSLYHYSNLSVNGQYSKVDGILTYDCTGSGLTIGHPGSTGNSSDFSIVDNIESYGNELDGVTVSNSKHILMSNLQVYNCLRNNIQICDLSSEIQIQNADIHGYSDVAGVAKGGQGIQILGGSGHNLNNINAYDNFGFGIYINGTTGPTSLGSEVNCYNNGQTNAFRIPANHDLWTASIMAENASYVYIDGSKAFTNQPSGSITQKYGIILSNVNHARVTNAQCYGNGIQNTVKFLGANSDVIVN